MYLDGKEGDLFATILRVRYCNKVSVSTKELRFRFHILKNW